MSPPRSLGRGQPAERPDDGLGGAGLVVAFISVMPPPAGSPMYGTVKTRVSRVLAKLGLRDRVQAVVFAYESALVRPGAT